jgi:hypothetical protein
MLSRPKRNSRNGPSSSLTNTWKTEANTAAVQKTSGLATRQPRRKGKYRTPN